MNYKDMVFNPIKDIDDADDLMPEGTEIGYTDEEHICYEFTKKAFEKGEVKDLILGNQVGDYDYRIMTPFYLSYDRIYTVEWDGYVYLEATDYDRLLDYGIYKYYEEKKDEKIISEVILALDKIFEEAVPFDVFSAFCFLYILANREFTDFDLGPEIYKKAGETINKIDWPKGFNDDFKFKGNYIEEKSGYNMGIIIKE